jgi:hypothetical protein
MLINKQAVLFCATAMVAACDNHPSSVLAAQSVSPAPAQQPAPCPTAEQLANRALSYSSIFSSPWEPLSTVSQSLTYLRTNLPSVPAEESAYLDNERQVVLEIDRNALVKRRLYYAWQAHKHVRIATELVDSAVELQRNAAHSTFNGNVVAAQMEWLDRMLNLLVAVNRAATSVLEFLVHEAYQPHSLLTQKQYDGLSMQASSTLPYNLQRATQCQFAYVTVKQ